MKRLIKIYQEQKVLRIELMNSFNGEQAETAQTNLDALHEKLHRHIKTRGFESKDISKAYTAVYGKYDPKNKSFI